MAETMTAVQTDIFEAINAQTAKIGRDHPDTSRLAAAHLLPKVGTKRRLVLDAITASDGLTDEEMQAVIPMGANTQRPRRVELVEAGLICDSQRRRRTTAGELAIVWERCG